MTQDEQSPARLRWAHLRFSVVGPLYHSPPQPGDLASRIAELAAQTWEHPTTRAPVHYSAKTIEHWYYTARKEADPIAALARKVPKHAGTHPKVTPGLATAIEKQYRDHPRWNYKLHYDNIVVLAKNDRSMCPVPAYATVRRFMIDRGWVRIRRRHVGKNDKPGIIRRETRSFEIQYVNGLWHFDFHEGRRNVLTPTGDRRKPYLLGVLDDCSRLCCHAQWYLDRENTQDLVHGLSQAIQKRGLPRAVLSDNGSPMKAAETVSGLTSLGITPYRTLSNSPEQNAKQENFWTRIENQLMPMLEGEPELTIELLNTATQAWVERGYHHALHSEIKMTPLERYLAGPSVARPSPTSEKLRSVFRMEVTRKQRQSDGTVSFAGVRFEVPSVYRTLTRLRLNVARWDLSSIHLLDPRSDRVLAILYPLDKAKNADGRRRTLETVPMLMMEPAKPSGIAPLLRQQMAEYAATGLPPGYLPKNLPNAPPIPEGGD